MEPIVAIIVLIAIIVSSVLVTVRVDRVYRGKLGRWAIVPTLVVFALAFCSISFGVVVAAAQIFPFSR